jgi:hypothetical protein
MHLTETQIRSIISELILEGYKDEQRFLQEKYPELSNEIGRLGPKYIAWLVARYGENPSREEIEPIRDAIVTIVNFARKDAGIGEKYRANEQFRSSVDEAFPLDTRSWQTPNDISSMTSEVIERILGLSERKKQRFGLDKSTDVERDRVGKVGPWNLWMPSTRERSCKIAQYDPVTLAPKTTWCTARTSGSNLFYSYVGRAGADMTLFYIIKDNPTDTQDWLSVGFVNGSPSLDGGDGGISVDRENVGLTSKRLKSILGSYHDEIMARLTDRNRELGGQHPAHQKIKDAAKSVDALKYLTGGLSADEAADLSMRILDEPNVAPEVLAALADDRDEQVRRLVAKNTSTPAGALMKLADDSEWKVRKSAAQNLSTPVEALMKLASDKRSDVAVGVAQNPSIPADVLRQMASSRDLSVIRALSKNTSAPSDVLVQLMDANGPHARDGVMRQNIAMNPSTPPDVLRQFAEDPWLRQVIPSNPSTPPDILEQLADDINWIIRNYVALNPSTPVNVLKKLAGDVNDSVSSKAQESLAKVEIKESALRQLVRRLVR